MSETHITVRRKLDQGGGWTLTLVGDRLTLTGGTHDEAYAPVEVGPEALPLLLADIQSLGCIGKAETA